MDWSDIAGAVGRHAPLLGAVFGGPAGAALSAVGAIVSSALGVEGTPDAVAKALETDPQAAIRLREIESAERIRLQELVLEGHRVALEERRAQLADVADARARDVALQQTGRNNVRADLMVLGATVGLIACLLTLVLYRDKVPAEAVGIISTIAGLFGACLKDAFTFEFGSSRSSANKDVTIQRLSTGA